MWRPLVLSLLSLTGVFLWGKDPAPLTPVEYPELRLHLDRLAKKMVQVSGTFHYLAEDGKSFQLRMGEHTIDVQFDAIGAEAQQALRELRNFSDVRILVTGRVERAGVQNDRILLVADKVDIQDESTRMAFDSRRGIVTVPEIRVNPFRYLHNSITMQGRFDFRDPNLELFRLWRGVDVIEVDYQALSKAQRREILGIKNFSDRPMRVTGNLRPAKTVGVAYHLDATALEIEPLLDESQLVALEAQRKSKDISYADIIRKPERYVGKLVELKGGFEVQEPLRRVVELWQGGDSIEIFYEQVPAEQMRVIQDLKPFSSAIVVVQGKVQAYEKASRRYFIMAKSITLEKAK